MVLVFSYSSFCGARVINVGPSGEYQKIQDARNASKPGDEIVAAVGRYYESLYFPDHDVVLRSTPPGDFEVAQGTMRMRQYAIEADPNVRLMMWSDAVNPYHNAPHLAMEKAAELVPRDVILCAWFYHWPDPQELIGKSVVYFKDLGFDVTGSPWYGHQNVHHWAQVLARQRRDGPHVLGEIYTSWSDAPVAPWQALHTMAEYSWRTDAVPLDAFLKMGK
jgi:hypothetical protein